MFMQQSLLTYIKLGKFFPNSVNLFNQLAPK